MTKQAIVRGLVLMSALLGPAPTMATSQRESVMGVVLQEWREGINGALSASFSASVSVRVSAGDCVSTLTRLWHPPGP